MEKAFNPKDLENMKRFLDAQDKIAENMRKGSVSFVKIATETRKTKKDIEAASERIKKLEAEQLSLQKEMLAMSGEELKIAKARYNLLVDEVKEQKELTEENEIILASLKKQVNLKNASIAIGRDAIKGAKKLYKEVKSLSIEYFKQDDTLRRTAVNIGLMGKHQEQFRKTVYKSALATQRLGMSATDVADTYGSYVDLVGRLIPLTTKAAYAMSEMAMGTALGKEGAAQMAASMEVFGMSIESTAKYVEDVSNMSEKMGVNSGKVLKTLSTNLRKAQTVRFKGGVEGMAKMAAQSTKIRMDMSSALDFAQSLWEPEKAIETAANLQMMGGAFAKMGDPIRLMFLGRNDPATLMNEMATAASSLSKKMGDGTYAITSTMELQKLKQIAADTGLEYEGLVESANTIRRQGDIGKMLTSGVDKEGKEFIASIAEYSKEKGGFVVSVDGETKKISELGQQQVANMMSESKTLEERAKSAQSLMTLFSNFFNSFKNLASSFFAGMELNLRKPLEALTLGSGKGTLASFSESISSAGERFGAFLVPFVQAIPGYITSLMNLGKSIAEFFSGDNFGSIKETAIKVWEGIKKVAGIIAQVGSMVTSVVSSIYKTFGPGGLLMAGLALLFRKQIGGMLGSLLGRGQKGTYTNPMITSDIGGGMGGGMGGGRGGTMGKKMFGRLGSKGGRSVLGRAASMGKFGKVGGGLMKGVVGGSNILGKAGGFLSKGLKLGGPLGLAALGMDIGRGFLDDPDSALGKGLGVGGSAATGAAFGAFLGPVGIAIGGLVGGLYGVVKEFSKKTEDSFNPSKLNEKLDSITKRSVGGSTSKLADGQIAPGSGAVISTAKGTFFPAKEDYITTSTNNPLTGGDNGGTKQLSINGSIKLDGGGVNVFDLMKDASFRQAITTMMVKEMENQNR